LVVVVVVVVLLVVVVVVVVRRRQRWQRQSVVPPNNKYDFELNYGGGEGGEGGADIAAWLGLTKSMGVCRTEQHTRASTKNLPS
jgi:hypothetical protein